MKTLVTTQKKPLTPAQLQTLMKVAELRTKGCTRTCDLRSV